MDIHTIVGAQFNAALEMLEATVRACPDELWEDSQRGNAFWRIAYHALLYTHLYLEDSLEAYRPWEKHRDEYTFDAADDPARADMVCPRSVVLEYVGFCRGRVTAQVPHLDVEAPSGFHWLPYTKLELQFYTLRHLQQHIGELMERLGPLADRVGWVGSLPA